MHPVFYLASIGTPEGDFAVTYSDTGLCALRFPCARKRVHEGSAGLQKRQRSRDPNAWCAWPAKVRRWHAMTAEALQRALSGREPRCLPPVDLSCGTEFQQAVWRALRQIRRGDTLSYGQVACIIGRPAASRAVGSACGANPLPVLIPCHRVLGAGGRLGGFSGGLHWKRLLLQREGKTF
jgi:methylated-DNA-[protein]-cysteine S-methyltransferase